MSIIVWLLPRMPKAGSLIRSAEPPAARIASWNFMLFAQTVGQSATKNAPEDASLFDVWRSRSPLTFNVTLCYRGSIQPISPLKQLAGLCHRDSSGTIQFHIFGYVYWYAENRKRTICTRSQTTHPTRLARRGRGSRLATSNQATSPTRPTHPAFLDFAIASRWPASPNWSWLIPAGLIG